MAKMTFSEWVSMKLFKTGDGLRKHPEGNLSVGSSDHPDTISHFVEDRNSGKTYMTPPSEWPGNGPYDPEPGKILRANNIAGNIGSPMAQYPMEHDGDHARRVHKGANKRTLEEIGSDRAEFNQFYRNTSGKGEYFRSPKSAEAVDNQDRSFREAIPQIASALRGGDQASEKKLREEHGNHLVDSSIRYNNQMSKQRAAGASLMQKILQYIIVGGLVLGMVYKGGEALVNEVAYQWDMIQMEMQPKAALAAPADVVGESVLEQTVDNVYVLDKPPAMEAVNIIPDEVTDNNLEKVVEAPVALTAAHYGLNPGIDAGDNFVGAHPKYGLIVVSKQCSEITGIDPEKVYLDGFDFAFNNAICPETEEQNGLYALAGLGTVVLGMIATIFGLGARAKRRDEVYQY